MTKRKVYQITMHVDSRDETSYLALTEDQAEVLADLFSRLSTNFDFTKDSVYINLFDIPGLDDYGQQS